MNPSGGLTVLIALTWIGCSDGPTAPSATSGDLSQPWTTASVEAVGGDAAQVDAAIEQARQHDRLLSLLVVKDGLLVVEEYFRGNLRDSLNDVRSVTKSVMSALIGVAIEEGFCAGVDDRIVDYLDPGVAPLDSAEQEIRIEHLLTMTSGFEWNEDGGFGDYVDWIRSDNHIEHLLAQPLINVPGSVFQYNSAAVHLLGVVLEGATELTLPDVADRFLFDAIGIERRAWEPLPGGFHNGGAGLDLRPRDLARFGQLYLQRGMSGSKVVIPEWWLTDTRQPRFTWRFDFGPLDGITYGYLWWVVDGEPEPAYYAWGFGGQFIYVVPSLRLVLVTTTEWRGMSSDGGPRPFEEAALELIVDWLIPAFR